MGSYCVTQLGFRATCRLGTIGTGDEYALLQVAWAKSGKFQTRNESEMKFAISQSEIDSSVQISSESVL